MQNLITDEEWKMLSAESRHRLNLLLAYPCEWFLHDDEANAWESACGLVWWFEVGSPAENEMAYCPKCGRHLTQRAVDFAPRCPKCNAVAGWHHEACEDYTPEPQSR